MFSFASALGTFSNSWFWSSGISSGSFCLITRLIFHNCLALFLTRLCSVLWGVSAAWWCRLGLWFFGSSWFKQLIQGGQIQAWQVGKFFLGGKAPMILDPSWGRGGVTILFDTLGWQESCTLPENAFRLIINAHQFIKHLDSQKVGLVCKIHTQSDFYTLCHLFQSWEYTLPLSLYFHVFFTVNIFL